MATAPEPTLKSGQILVLDLPFFAPSVNHYWEQRIHGGKFIGKRGRLFIKQIADYVLTNRLAYSVGGQAVDVALILYPPTKAVYDCDNYCKALFDALTRAKFWTDDAQIKTMRVFMRGAVKNGRMDFAVRLHQPNELTAAQQLGAAT